MFLWCPSSSSTSLSTTISCSTNVSLAITNVTVNEDGSIWDHEGEILYPPGTHWSNPGEEDVHMVCPCNINERPCLRKCCPMGQGMTNKMECFDYDHNFNIEVKEEDDSKMVEGKKHFALLYGNPCKNKRFVLEPDVHTDDEFWIRASDGVLVTPHYDMSEYGPDSFCLDYYPERKLHLPAICITEDMLEDDDDSKSLAFKIYPIFMIISTIFLLATFLVYALIPELRNLHGMCLMSHVGSLSVTYIFLAIVQIGGKDISDDLCRASGKMLFI
ncbi:hypothetical protein J437_LFUL014824 [Ladona fulva]|uniref:Methuselah N-terminal domain-containing protein n=1 Tax=Ladona fulva TaxID=123851 RepID=A0A8K0KQY1_LADFU|nr:hypothetical protein J437_LFUL014824 [Ladona fulva]